MKTTKQVVTEGRMTEEVAFAVLTRSKMTSGALGNLTVNEAKSLARDIATQIRNTLSYIEQEGLSLTDEQANSRSFWITQIRNAGKDFNQPPKI